MLSYRCSRLGLRYLSVRICNDLPHANGHHSVEPPAGQRPSSRPPTPLSQPSERELFSNAASRAGGVIRVCKRHLDIGNAYPPRFPPFWAIVDSIAMQRRRSETMSDRKSTRLNSSHVAISYAVFCLKK